MGRYYNSGIGKGVGTSPQTSLDNQEYENKVKELEENENSKNINVETNGIETINENNFPFEISENKYEKYLFVLDHEVGGSKAIFLKDVLGYKLGDGKILHEAILKAIKDKKPYNIEQTEYGIKYKFKAKIKGNNESYCEANVVVVVQKDNGKLVWRIVTLYPGKKER